MLDRGRRNERGAAVVEAAFVLPMLVLFFAAIVDFGFILNDLQQINNATFRAVRELSVDEYSGAAGCVADPDTALDTEKLVCMVRNFSGR
ncbi:MAG: pilus assembly protein, partial [Acidimicrobiia bacterium]|nr:pilus assembly protein [Acidimicrobiia bacterium]